jgi:hypothetical protein
MAANLREEMHQAIDIYKLGSKEVLLASQELDPYMVEEQKKRLREHNLKIAKEIENLYHEGLYYEEARRKVYRKYGRKE